MRCWTVSANRTVAEGKVYRMIIESADHVDISLKVELGSIFETSQAAMQICCVHSIWSHLMLRTVIAITMEVWRPYHPIAGK